MPEIRNIVILTGAGISAESGIDTFRAEGGLWEQHRVEDVATPEGFARDPDLVLRFYDMRREAIQTKQPNPAHDALARLDQHWQGNLLIVTQNVDDLHERAGAKRVLHMHGTHLNAWCTACDAKNPWAGPLANRPPCPNCGTNALRPDVGAVGARLLFPDGTLQHGGVVLGLGAGAGHLHLGAAGNAWGYLGRARLAGEFSAVTAACLAVERSKFDAVGGFDPRGLRINYGDVDLCLRLGQRGWRTIYTPYAVLTHRESASRSKAPDVAEAAELARRWPALLADDPHYSPHLSRLRADGVWDPPGD